MKTKERRKVKEGLEEETPRVFTAEPIDVGRTVRRGSVRVLGSRSVSELARAASAPDDDERLSAEIDSMLRQVREIRAETREDDEEMARLGEETRHYLREIHRTLNLKAA